MMSLRESAVSDPEWAAAYETAESTGCGFPGEVAGVVLRRLPLGAPVAPGALDLAVQAEAACCQACWDHCTANRELLTTPNPD